MPRKRSALTHVGPDGRVRMVDVGDKPVTAREAVARGSIAMSATARKLIKGGNNKKGDPIQAARLAGIKAILNFSPGTLKVPDDVKLKSVDLTVSLESLSFYLARGEMDE